MRGRTQQSLLKVLAESVVDGQRHNERRHARRHSQDGDRGDHPDKSLAPLGAQVSGRDEKFKSHEGSRKRLAFSGSLVGIIDGSPL